MLEKVIDIAKGAGAILIRYKNGKFDVKQKGGNPDDLVTSADYASDEYIRGRLEKEFAGDKILSEETQSSITDFSGRVWIVDPLDGTDLFSQRKAGFCVIIGLCNDGIPTLGVVYNPVNDELYFAEKGKGAYLLRGKAKKRLSVSKIDSISQAKAIIKPSYEKTKKYDKLPELIRVKEQVSGYSAGIKIMKIACGKLEFYFDSAYRASKWDTCGSQIILEEAGGKITGLSAPLDYYQQESRWQEPFLASNNAIHQATLDKILKYAP